MERSRPLNLVQNAFSTKLPGDGGGGAWGVNELKVLEPQYFFFIDPCY